MNKQICTCLGSCRGAERLGEGWVCALTLEPPVEGHPDNQTFCSPASLKPHCNECGGEHEPSGARLDCVRFWKQRAIAATELVEWARTLLCSATAAKTLAELQSRQWCEGFGKWFAESHTIPGLSHDWGCAKLLYDWISEGTYRTVVYRHDRTFVAADESSNKMVRADTLPALCDGLLGWPANAEPLPPSKWVKLSP